MSGTSGPGNASHSHIYPIDPSTGAPMDPSVPTTPSTKSTTSPDVPTVTEKLGKTGFPIWVVEGGHLESHHVSYMSHSEASGSPEENAMNPNYTAAEGNPRAAGWVILAVMITLSITFAILLLPHSSAPSTPGLTPMS